MVTPILTDKASILKCTKYLFLHRNLFKFEAQDLCICIRPRPKVSSLLWRKIFNGALNKAFDPFDASADKGNNTPKITHAFFIIIIIIYKYLGNYR